MIVHIFMVAFNYKLETLATIYELDFKIPLQNE